MSDVVNKIIIWEISKGLISGFVKGLPFLAIFNKCVTYYNFNVLFISECQKQKLRCGLSRFINCLRMRFTPMVRNLNRMLDLKSMKMLDHYSQFNPSPLTINQFMEFGKTATEEESFTFLRKEIPVRLSNIMKEINLLPSNLLQMPSTLTLQARMSEIFVI